MDYFFTIQLFHISNYYHDHLLINYVIVHSNLFLVISALVRLCHLYGMEVALLGTNLSAIKGGFLKKKMVDTFNVDIYLVSTFH